MPPASPSEALLPGGATIRGPRSPSPSAPLRHPQHPTCPPAVAPLSAGTSVTAGRTSEGHQVKLTWQRFLCICVQGDTLGLFARHHCLLITPCLCYHCCVLSRNFKIKPKVPNGPGGRLGHSTLRPVSNGDMKSPLY